MEQHGLEPSRERSSGARRWKNPVEDVRCGGREQRSPATLWNAVSESPQPSTNRIEQPAARQQRDDTRQQQRFDDRSLAGGELVEPVMRSQLLEHQLDLPVAGVELVCIEVLRRDVGQVEPVRPAVGVAHADQTQAAPVHAPAAGADPTLEPDLHLDIEDHTREPVGHFVEPTSLKLDGASTPATMHAHDARIRARRQSRQEVAAVSVNAIKELLAEEAEVEDQQAVAYPRSHAQRAAVIGPFAGELHPLHPASGDAHHQMQLRRRGAGVRPRARSDQRPWPASTPCFSSHHAAIRTRMRRLEGPAVCRRPAADPADGRA